MKKKIIVQNYYTKEVFNFPDEDDEDDEDEGKDEGKDESYKFAFLKVKKKTNEVKKEYIYSDDSLIILKRKIENKLFIHSDYQLLLYKKSNKIIGSNEIYSDKKEFINNFLINENNVIGNDIYDGILFINLLEYLENKFDIFWLNGLSSYQLTELWINKIHKLWYSVSSNDFINIIKNNEIKKGTYLKIITDIEKIRNINLLDDIKYTNYTLLDVKIFRIYKNMINLFIVFDQFIPNTKYDKAICKFNENKIFKKFLVKKIKDSSSKEKIDKIPKNVGITIGQNIYISIDGKVLFKKSDTEFIDNILSNNVIKEENKNYKYTFQLNSEYSIDKNFIFSEFPFSVEKDYKSRKNSITFYYKRVSLEKDAFFHENQQGAYIKISIPEGLTGMHNITISNIKNKFDIENVQLFLVKIFNLYAIKKGNIENKSNINSATNINEIDPKLFDFKKYGKKIYSRICQKNKQPHGFIKENINFDSDLFKGLKPESILEYPNLTHEGKTTVFICNKKEYKNITFLKNIKTNDGYCIPCCSKKNKTKSKFFAKCIEKATSGKGETKTKQLSNIFYIKKYDSRKKLENNKFSFLPQLLHDFLNKFNSKCNIKYNIITIGKGCYILVGNESINKEDSINFNYDSKTNELSLINKYDVLSSIKKISENKTKYIINDTFICKVSSLEEKNYEIIYEHPPDSLITKKIISLLKNIYKQSETENIIINYTKKYKNIKQLMYDDGFINYLIVNDEIKIPIKPHLAINNLPIIKEYKKENKKNIVDRYIKENEIHKYILDKKGNLIGYKLNNLLYIFFEKEKFNTEIQEKETETFYYTSDDNSKLDKKYILSMKEIDMYYIYLYNVSYWLNKPFGEIKPITISDLTKMYKTNEDKRFINDYMLFKTKDYDKMEYWKKYKNMIIDGKEKTEKILFSMTKPYIIFSELSSDKINIIKKIDNKLHIPEKLYLKYTKLIAYEIDNNDIKRYQILNNKISKVINTNKFTKYKGVEIIKINN